MIAVILIGGQGTRLRPLTCDVPKPLLPVLNRPFLSYQFDILKSHGVRDIVLCTSYQSGAFSRALGDGRRFGVRLRYVHERAPLGTGGALKNAEPLLRGRGTALALNGDVLNTLDIRAFLKFHRKRRSELTIALTRVKDPTVYGLVLTDENGKVRKFLEKPSWDEIETNTINAGAYLFEPGVLSRVPAKGPYSLERSLFPQMLADRRPLYGYVTTGYWIDIGTLERYLQVHLDILAGTTPFKPAAARRRESLLLGPKVALGRALNLNGGRAVLGEGTVVADFASFSGQVCVGPRCRIGKGASLKDCVVLEGTVIGDGARLERCVIGSGCRIGAQAAVTGKTALASRSTVRPYSCL